MIDLGFIQFQAKPLTLIIDQPLLLTNAYQART